VICAFGAAAAILALVVLLLALWLQPTTAAQIGDKRADEEDDS
jgi:hypothetical protein